MNKWTGDIVRLTLDTDDPAIMLLLALRRDVDSVPLAELVDLNTATTVLRLARQHPAPEPWSLHGRYGAVALAIVVVYTVSVIAMLVWLLS